MRGEKAMIELTQEQKKRYDRNIRIKGIGESGQITLLKSRVLVIGAGGLGSPVTLYLAAAGVGKIGIIDDDVVDISNLQRQILYNAEDIGLSKALLAKKRVLGLNSGIEVSAEKMRIDVTNIESIIVPYDIIIDCTDNAPTKFLINDACVKNKKPFVHGGVVKMYGQVMTYVPGHACLRCAVELPNEYTVQTAKEVGIIGAAAGVIGSMQAGEAIKYITGIGKCLIDSLYVYDMETGEGSKKSIKKEKKCIVCGKNAKSDPLSPIW